VGLPRYNVFLVEQVLHATEDLDGLAYPIEAGQIRHKIAVGLAKACIRVAVAIDLVVHVVGTGIGLAHLVTRDEREIGRAHV